MSRESQIKEIQHYIIPQLKKANGYKKLSMKIGRDRVYVYCGSILISAYKLK